MSSHYHRPLGGYQIAVRAKQATQDGFSVSGIEVLGRFIEQYDLRRRDDCPGK